MGSVIEKKKIYHRNYRVHFELQELIILIVYLRDLTLIIDSAALATVNRWRFPIGKFSITTLDFTSNITYTSQIVSTYTDSSQELLYIITFMYFTMF